MPPEGFDALTEMLRSRLEVNQSKAANAANSGPISVHAAYTNSQTMMTPYPGTSLHVTDFWKESFNFYHSQCRITIERCFGVFISRWEIFWFASAYDLQFFCEIVSACCRLHNFCIKLKLLGMPTKASATVAAGVVQPALDANVVRVDASWKYVGDPAFKETGSGNSLRDVVLGTVKDRLVCS
jgi:hypothetical protein